MSGLVEFLRARLDEDEAAARAAAHAERTDAWTTLPDSYGGVLDGTGNRSVAVGYGDVMAPETAIHIARHDPARVLAELEAKRRILRDLEQAEFTLSVAGEGTPPHDLMTGAVNTLRRTVRLLTAAFANHPDYREEWKP